MIVRIANIVGKRLIRRWIQRGAPGSHARLVRRAQARSRRSPQDGDGPAIVAPEPVVAPRGKGVFVRTVAGAGGVDRIVGVAQWAGLSWVCVQTFWKDHGENLNLNELAQLHAALDARGIQMWLWAWAEPAQIGTLAEVLKQTVEVTPFTGLMLDIEGLGWTSLSHDDAERQAVLLFAAARETVGQRPVGVTSYGWPTSFPAFPWKMLSELADFGVPQAYKGLEVGLDYQRLSVEAYENLGFLDVVPALAAFDWSGAEMTVIYERTPRPVSAVIWWDFYNADQDQTGGRWRAIQAAGMRAELPDAMR